MNKYSKILLTGALSAVILTACTVQEDTKISTIDDNSKEVIVVDINENEDSELHDKISSFYLNDKTDHYDFSTKLLQGDKYSIRIPVLVNYKGELSMDYINQSIRAHADKLVSNTSDVADGVKLVYTSEIVSQNNNFISIKFTGELPYEGSSYKLLSGLVIDLNSTNTITYENLFTKDKTTLNNQFEKAAKLINTTVFSPDDYMLMFIEDSNIVFAYMENDMAIEFTEIKIPLDSVIDNLQIDFGERPAS